MSRVPCVPVNARRKRAGFTLIELLVVIVILGGLVGLAVLSTGSAGTSRVLRDEAQRLAGLIGVLADEAVLDNREYGLRVDSQGYQVLRYDETGARWTPIEQDAARRLPEWARLDLQLDGTPLKLASADSSPREAQGTAARPQILILSSGELSPFTLRVADRRPDGGAWLLASDGFRLPEARPADTAP